MIICNFRLLEESFLIIFNLLRRCLKFLTGSFRPQLHNDFILRFLFSNNRVILLIQVLMHILDMKVYVVF